MNTLIDNAFPFSAGDLVAWVQRRKDGSIIRYELTPTIEVPKHFAQQGAYHYPVSSVAKWCDHTPDLLKPVFVDPKGNYKLFAGDLAGVRKAKDLFDLVIDGGDVLSLPKPLDILEGDEVLVKALSSYTLRTTRTKPRVLQIDWADRMAPDLHPEFWVELLGRLKGNVICCCQGGHGRTGTSLVALMMAATDYSPLDAITHLRTIHCARAIESVTQHQYLNRVAEYLKRDMNALDAEDVKDFRSRFLNDVTSKFAKSYQSQLLAETVKKES